MSGIDLHDFAKVLWPINRSITGDGVRETLIHIQGHLPTLKVREVPTGTSVFDWEIPKEWKVNEAYIITPEGNRICDVKVNNLHLVGYSIPFRGILSLEELQKHLNSLEDQPDAIPYITSYYSERWGFCITHEERCSLKEGNYTIVVDSVLFDGSLTYGEVLIPGSVDKEVFISTYICHPSMANNELSGPVVTTFLAKWLLSQGELRYTYRIVFIPETIGSITYLSENLEVLKKNVIAGFNVSCVGDDRAYSYLPSRSGETLSDKVALHALRHTDTDFKKYTWLDRGSDERQYCAPNIDLPIATICRSKYGEYPEYHTSLDTLDRVVTPRGLEGGFEILKKAIEILENNKYPLVTVLCEPQLGKRGLYPTLSTKKSGLQVKNMMNLITYSDGSKSLLEIAELCGTPFSELLELTNILKKAGLIEMSDTITSKL